MRGKVILYETSSSEIDWLAFGREDLRKRLTRHEQELLLHPSDLSVVYDEAVTMLKAGKGRGVSLTLPCTWDFSGVEDRSLPFWLQSFSWQACLMDAYFLTGDTEYRELLFAWVFDWIAAYPAVDRRDPWAWHDDAAGRRALYFGLFLLAFEKVLTEEQISALHRCLAMHADLLRREDFYRIFHNHGFYQDMALALYVLCFGEEAEYWTKLSASRSRVYLDAKISGEGVHMEHSPKYHGSMAKAIAWLAIVFRRLDAAYSAELMKRLEKMTEYNYWITMPDGALPPIGDTPRKKANELLYESGEIKTEPKRRIRIFPDTGYGIIRKETPSCADTWMMLLAATHSEVHKHNDDLSFLISHGGELITEAGSRNYNYSDPLTEYCYSSYGHNVLFVDGRGWGMKPTHLPLIEKAAYKTGIIAWEDTPEVSSVTGRQIRYPGVIQIRTLRYNRKRETITVEDRIALEKPSALRLIYHIAPGIAAEQDGPSGWILRRGSCEVARLVIEANARELSARLLKNSEPPWRTEVFWGKPEAQQGSLLIADCTGNEGLTVINLRVSLV